MTKQTTPLLSPAFVRTWRNCKSCELHHNCPPRERVLPRVFRYPAGTRVGHAPPFHEHPIILMVGEAAGTTEAANGEPFIGRSGGILKDAIEDAIEESGYGGDYYWIVTNTILCTPWEDAGRAKIGKPTKKQMNACRGHIETLIGTYNPSIILALGKHATDSLSGHIEHHSFVHPSFMLRNGGRDSMDYAQFTLDLSDLLTEDNDG